MMNSTPTPRRSVHASAKRSLMRALLAAFVVTSPVLARAGDGLGDLSQRLREGDRAAIDELLARTRPSSIELSDSNARIAQLRAEIEQLNARRFGRPLFQLANPKPVARGGAESEAATPGRVDALRESMAWLRAGEPERALRALPPADASTSDADVALYLEARALEKLGRRAEALDTYRRAAASAVSPTLRLRAASDVAHLEWRERVLGPRGGRP